MILFVIIAVNHLCKHLDRNINASAPTNAVCDGGTDIQKRCSGKLYTTSPAPPVARISKATAIRNGFTVRGLVLVSQGQPPVDKQSAVIHYHTSMAVFRSWRNERIITDDDLTRIAVMLAQKYDLPLDSIYLDQDLLYPEKRANIP